MLSRARVNSRFSNTCGQGVGNINGLGDEKDIGLNINSFP